MIGLSPSASRLYAHIAELCASRSLPPRASDIKSSICPDRKMLRLKQLEKHGFISIDRFDRITALEPPHLLVMRETCALTGLSEEEIRGECHAVLLVRARRIIAKRLRNEFSYYVAQIAIVLNRNDKSVWDYLRPDRTQRRSKARSVALYGERAAA